MSTPSRKQQLEALLTDDPNDPFLHYGLAMEYVSEGDDTEAARRFAGVFDVAPDYVPAYLQAGQCLTRLGRADEARAAFRRGIETARRQGDLHAAEEMQAFLDSLA